MSKNLDRQLVPKAGARAHHWSTVLVRIGAGVLLLLALAAIVSQLNLHRNLHRLDARMLSGPADGSANALVAELADVAAKGSGKLVNVPSAGSFENVERLRAARGSCDTAFALAQDGEIDAQGGLELIGRLAKSDSVFLLAKNGDTIAGAAALAHAKIGVGLEGSASARLAQQVFGLPDLAALGVDLRHVATPDAVAMAKDGRLDAALVVVDEDAPWLGQTLRAGELQIVGLAHADVIARRIPHLRTGRIGAGQFDVVHMIPNEDKRVLRLETLVLGNGCAGRSATLDLMTVLSRRFPDFIRHNKETANTTGLPLASAARGFFDQEGPELADEYVPWLVDVMPPANWAYILMAVSLLFNAMGFGHRFRLWRIDAARVKLEAELGALFGPTTTLGDIARATPEEAAHAHDTPAHRARIEEIVRELEELAARSRRQSLSVLVPMGQEMAYRYQEGVVYETLAVLRDFLRRTRPV